MILQTLEEIDTNEYLSRRRLENEITHKDRIIEVYEKLPKMKELDNQISDITFGTIRSRLKKGSAPDDGESAKMQEQISKISLTRRNSC